MIVGADGTMIVDADIPEEYVRTTGDTWGAYRWCKQVQQDRDRGVWLPEPPAVEVVSIPAMKEQE